MSLRAAAVCFCTFFFATAQVDPEAYYQGLLAKYTGRYAECLSQDKGIATQGVNVAIVLDVSGPTRAATAGGTTLDVLRNAALRFARALPQTVNVAMVVYGHNGDMTLAGKDVSCKATDLVGPAGPYHGSLVAPLIERLKPGGWTPLQSAVKKANESFAGVSDLFVENRIYLLAAGMDTCGGRPREAARLAHADKVRTVINVASVTTSPAEQEELKAVASAGGGEFFADANPAALNRYFDNQVKAIREQYKQSQTLPACFETRLTQERSSIQHELAVDSTGNTPRINAQVVNLVNKWLQQRQERIRAMAGRRDLTAEMLSRELQAKP